MSAVSVELATCNGPNRPVIDVRFAFDANDVRHVKTISGARWQAKGKHWHVPLSMSNCRALRSAFGQRLKIGPSLRSWAKEAVREENTLGSIALSDSASLSRLPAELPFLYEAIHLGPKGLQMSESEKVAALAGPASYQAADVAFLSGAQAPLNGNQPGLGKTIETIGAVWEAGLEEGAHLVICPANAIEAVWEDELAYWQQGSSKRVEVFAVNGTKKQRLETLKSFEQSSAEVRWLVVNPEMIRWTKSKTNEGPHTMPAKGAANGACYCDASGDSHWHYVEDFPALYSTKWNTIIIDECHKNSIRNHRSLTARSLQTLAIAPNGKRIALSGTPMRKQGGSDIWGILHWLRPDVFTGFWSFAGNYFNIDDNGYGRSVGDLVQEEKFYVDMRPYLLRRKKSECLPWLPPKQHIDVMCEMTKAQAKVYDEMASMGAVVLGDQELSTTSILAEITRLRQFATTLCELAEGGEVRPTLESGKVASMMEKMEEHGLFDGSADSPHVVFSQSKPLVYLVAGALREKGLRVEVLTGDQNKKGQRKAIKDAFQSGQIDVLCIVTTAGGVALTLDIADVAHFLDQTWSPDDQEQAEDRIHRASRNHQVVIYNYLTKDTIDQIIYEANLTKRSTHELILDVRREVLKQIEGRK